MRGQMKSQLVEYVTKRPNEPVHLHSIMEDLGFTKQQTQQGMLRLVGAGFIEVVLASTSWIYRPDRAAEMNGKPVAVAAKETKLGDLVEVVGRDGDLLEVVRVLTDGRLLLQDHNGDLWAAVKLDI